MRTKKLISLFIVTIGSICAFSTNAEVCETRGITAFKTWYDFSSVSSPTTPMSGYTEELEETRSWTHCHKNLLQTTRVHLRRQARRNAAKAAASALALTSAITVGDGSFVNYISSICVNHNVQIYRTAVRAETGLAGTNAQPWYYLRHHSAGGSC